MRLLLAEDNARLSDLLGGAIRQAGYRLDVAGTVAELTASATTVAYDLIVVDLGLPDGDGISAIRTLRAAGQTTPILIITARDQIGDKIIGLDSGADDYLTKPFNHGEFLARVRALLRRPSLISGPVLKVGAIEFDERTGQCQIEGRTTELRTSERRLLALLMRRPDTIVGKSTIEESLSEYGKELSSNAVHVLVSRLRSILSESKHAGVRIETVRGVGYVLRSHV